MGHLLVTKKKDVITVGKLVVITGPPAVGKSRLLREIYQMDPNNTWMISDDFRGLTGRATRTLKRFALAKSFDEFMSKTEQVLPSISDGILLIDGANSELHSDFGADRRHQYCL